ncbi:RDD family protein [Microbacterium sp. A93]|uniref:RDD family protein n=1 Tax=Microbacterium sp. A93 TaxID=3450716 RepID=UPI003F42E6CA
MTQPAFGTVAQTSRRAVAYIIDAAIAAGIGIVLGIILAVVAVSAGLEGMLGVLAIGGPLISVVMLGWFIVYTLMQSGRGSIGMRAQGIRLVREVDGAPLGFGMTLVRNIIFGLAASIVVGYFTPLFDGSGRFQGWHDKVAKSLMLESRTLPTAGSAAAPPTQAMQVPPRPPLPSVQPGAPTLAAAPRPTVPQMPMVPQMPVVPRMPAVPAMPSVAPVAPDAPVPPAPVAAAPRPPAPVAEDALIAFVPGVTQDAPPQRPEQIDDVTVSLPDPERTTVPDLVPVSYEAESEDIEDTRISIPGHRLVFTWDDGTRVPVSGRTIFGRNPQPEQGATIVSVRDETLSLSKTHFEAGGDVSGGWVMDRHSTNGVTIVRDGERITCAPGEQVGIRLGDAIEIGDRIVTIGGYV